MSFAKFKITISFFEDILKFSIHKKKEVFQDVNGRVFDAKSGNLLFKDFYAIIEPLSGNENQKAIKVVLTVAHLDHNILHNEFSNLKALCQKCHLDYDKEHHKKK